MGHPVIQMCSAKLRLALIKADLIPQLVITLNTLSLSFVEKADIHINLMNSITWSIWLASPEGLTQLEIEDHHGQQAARETKQTEASDHFDQFLTPLWPTNTVWILSRQSPSIVAALSFTFAATLSLLPNGSDPSLPFIAVCVDVIAAQDIHVLPHLPSAFWISLAHQLVNLTTPSWLALFEPEGSVGTFLELMGDTQWEWNRTRGDERQMKKTVHRMLQMEGIEDVIDEKLRNRKNRFFVGWLDKASIRWNNLLGMNLSKVE
ncbi:hypothetical protein BLNAU_8703 [Blattamonas nauphoetae]|uniref:Uncharacterized protein n=1 Tax=Blattamonas nauphoetae TaxID=2049346 RepID=A0ABQ9XXX2_9EUKA|nr:hypothetical protein BLNAU_8703 [Blattamonas nauphoetae]